MLLVFSAYLVLASIIVTSVSFVSIVSIVSTLNHVGFRANPCLREGGDINNSLIKTLRNVLALGLRLRYSVMYDFSRL